MIMILECPPGFNIRCLHLLLHFNWHIEIHCIVRTQNVFFCEMEIRLKTHYLVTLFWDREWTMSFIYLQCKIVNIYHKDAFG